MRKRKQAFVELTSLERALKDEIRLVSTLEMHDILEYYLLKGHFIDEPPKGFCPHNHAYVEGTSDCRECRNERQRRDYYKRQKQKRKSDILNQLMKGNND